MTPNRPTYTIDCPDCDWQSTTFDEIAGELAAKVDAEIHYTDTHGDRIPDAADFGDHQCPECLDTDGFNGTVSCSACGFVPPEARA